MIKVGICGGIGSGKSTICDMFASRGVAIYSADDRAKELMQGGELSQSLVAAFGKECYLPDGSLNRVWLAARVFGDDQQLSLLNSIVHPAVRADFERWASEQSGDYVIFEAAILFEAGFASAVDVTVAVVAPRALRLERAMKRDGATREQIEARMAAQASDDTLVAAANFTVVNIALDDVAKDVELLDGRFRALAARQNIES